MWRVDTSDIERYMSITDDFVKDFFNWINNNKGQPESVIERSLEKDDTKFGNVVNRLNTLSELLISLTLQGDVEAVINQYENMTLDYFAYITSGANTVGFSNKTNEIIERLFGYFYKDLLNTKTFWEQYDNGFNNPSKRKFRDEFGRNHPICPYCDTNNIMFYKESNSDHFLAYSHFPLLSIHWKNLVVSCLSCNLYIKNDQFIGTKDGISEYIPILHPYFDEVAEYITFKFDDELNISITESDNEKAINYCELFELEEKYEGAIHEAISVWEGVQSDVISNYLIGLNDEVNELIKLEQIYSEIVNRKKSEKEDKKGTIRFTKLIIDLFEYKLSAQEKNNELEFLMNEIKSRRTSTSPLIPSL
ncbi:hypothetical protein V2I71_12685 [Peribacillus frigoritolerans]|uniref:hypothetical protein n=1 Tax=Peribacillus frigoritolerans TaxID=450367 RepID=UPI002ED472C7|nr:hypothetical protein V2I71_12685 [Peribacillus frigoritolerans]